MIKHVHRVLIFGLFVLLAVSSIRVATGQGKPKPTTGAVAPDATSPTPITASGVKTSHQESSGPDCFGRDAEEPICAMAKPSDKGLVTPSVIPPMDLVWTKTDLIGLPLNPKWEWQTQPGNI